MAKGSTGTSMGGTIEYTRMKRKKKPEAWGLPRQKKGLCPKCGYYYQETCTFDDTKNPAKAQCENFTPRHLSNVRASELKKERTSSRLKNLEPIPCECKNCINWTGHKCRLDLERKIKDGKCKHFRTYKTNGYTLEREERKEIVAHNKTIDTSKTAAKTAAPPIVSMAALRKACDASYLTMDTLRKCKKKIRLGNGRYEIECINPDPLTIKLKGLNGARKIYIVKE